MNHFKVVGKVVKIESLVSSIVKGSSVIRVDVQIDSVDFGKRYRDLNEIELPNEVSFEFFKYMHFHFDNNLRNAKLIPVEEETTRAHQLEDQVQSWLKGVRVGHNIEFQATHTNNLGILDMQPHMFYKNITHYQPYTIHSEHQEGWGIPRFIENKDKNEEIDLTNEHVGEKPSFRKRIIPFLKRLFIEIIWNSLVSVWKWLFSNPS